MKKFIYTFVLVIIVHCTFNIENCLCQWQSDVRLTNFSYTSETSLNNAWCIAVSGNVVHVVWFDWRDVNPEIYYKRSSDGGVSWGTEISLTNNTYGSVSPSISVSGSFVHVVWRDNCNGYYEIYYKRSTDGGITWGANTRLTNNIIYSGFPSVAVSGSVVHVVWHDARPSNYEIYYKRSSDAGVSWGTDTRLTNNSATSQYPSISVSGSVVHVVWRDERDGNREIYYKRSTDAGVNWESDVRLTINHTWSDYPSIAVSGSVVHIVWNDDPEGAYINFEIYYKRSTDGGVSWGTDTRLTNATSNSYCPSVAVSGSVLHVVWEDNRNGNYEIYYKRSTDAGINWGADTRLTNNPANSENPSVAVSGSAVYVVWSDNRDGNYEIYYKRDPTGNLIGIKNISSEIPSSYSLEQNYPNPFNPTTKIKFDIPPLNPPLVKGGRGLPSRGVSLKVYNLLGKEIATLVSEQLAPGTYSVDFDATNFPSGIYFYRLITEGFSETKRMTLIR